MENFLGQIYCWFKSFYGDNLSYFLWGFDPATEAYTNPNLYNFVGIIIIVISLPGQPHQNSNSFLRYLMSKAAL